MSHTTQAQYKMRGAILVASFFAILVVIFMPIFPGGHNGLDYLDNFFNELSKGSANYIKEQREKAVVYNGQEFSATLKLKSEKSAATVASLFTAHGISAEVNAAEVKVEGRDFGQMIKVILDDAESMYNNKSEDLQVRYSMDGKEAFYSWYLGLSSMEKDFTTNSKFAEAKFIKSLSAKAIEPAYNYYGVQHKSVKDEVFLLVAALVFYVIYTVWYGFGLLFLFEGMGIKLEH